MLTIDLLPTFLAAAGTEPDPSWHVDGVNLLPVWTHDSAARPTLDRTVFWEWRSEGTNQLAAMNGPFKLVVTNDGKPELFDVLADPAERRNVSAQHPEISKQLHDQLNAWIATENP